MAAANESSIVVVTDDTGVIYGALSQSAPQGEGAPTRFGLHASDGRITHQISLPGGLRSSELGPEFFDAYRVVIDDGNAVLVRREDR